MPSKPQPDIPVILHILLGKKRFAHGRVAIEPYRLCVSPVSVKIALLILPEGPIARFQGIYKCSYTDEAAIPAAYYGYAALAQGLGVIQGDGGAFAAGRTATRAEAAAMIYNLLSYR